MKPVAGVEFLQLDFLDDDRAGAAQSDARRQGRRRALRHGGERDRPSPDRPSAHHGAGRGGGRISRARCSRRAGAFSCKVLQGGTEAALLAELKRDFASVKHVKPPASRTDSAELYLLATRLSRRDRRRVALVRRALGTCASFASSAPTAQAAGIGRQRAWKARRRIGGLRRDQPSSGRRQHQEGRRKIGGAHRSCECLSRSVISTTSAPTATPVEATIAARRRPSRWRGSSAPARSRHRRWC